MMFSSRWWWSTLIVIAGIGLAIRLGFWQIDRNAQRQASVNQIRAIQSMPILVLDQAPIPQDIEGMEYRQVVATGKFDFEHQVALRNQVRSRMTGTDPGYALVTPLILSNGWVVLVERGWIPGMIPDAWLNLTNLG
jgi:surfeit locus 1 family protein